MTEQQQRGLDPAEVEVAGTIGLGAPPDGHGTKQNSLWSDAWGQLKRNPLFWIGSLLGVFFVTMAIVPQLYSRGADPRDCDLANSKLPPSGDHWFGFDQQ